MEGFNYVSSSNSFYYYLGNAVFNNQLDAKAMLFFNKKVENFYKLLLSYMPNIERRHLIFSSLPKKMDDSYLYWFWSINSTNQYNTFYFKKIVNFGDEVFINLDILDKYYRMSKLNQTVNLFSNRKKNKHFALFLNKNFKMLNTEFIFHLNDINLFKLNLPKYYILIQKTNDNWVKEGFNNYNNFLNYKNFYNFNSFNNLRLLRVNKVLVLPVDIFINVITNSFDVVHSWFIPGLGFKMDCVPGRSTHHTLYLDIPGIYYGQCAEICGRLHHHMPIRVCGLIFEQFYIWYIHFYFNVRLNDQIKLSKIRCEILK